MATRSSGLDTGYYKAGWLCSGALAGSSHGVTPRTLIKDIRDVTVDDLRGFDAIVHMAELSNDPIGDLIGDVTYEINHCGSVHLADCAKRAGVGRFLYMSSCSVYGIADGTVDETSPVNPLTPYARCKALVERDLTAMADDDFSPTFLRNATAFGASPTDAVRHRAEQSGGPGVDRTPHRHDQRRHTVATTGACAGHRTGDQVRTSRRPQIVHSLVVNVGADENNRTVREIAETVSAEFPGCELTFGPPNADNRSYRVAFGKIREVFPDFRAAWDVAAGAAQLHRVFQSIAMDPETFQGRGHTRLRQIEYLLKTGQVDERLFWKEMQ